MTNRLELLLPLALTMLLAACGGDHTDRQESNAAPSVTIMAFNVENLFDNDDDAGKNDHTFLAIEDKQNDAHKALCEPIERDFWRQQCLDWDWSDEIIDRKLAAVAGAISRSARAAVPTSLRCRKWRTSGFSSACARSTWQTQATGLPYSSKAMTCAASMSRS